MRYSAQWLLPLLVVVGGACTTEREIATDPATSAPLVVASDLDNPPFAQVDEHGEERGRDVEMMKSVAAALHRRIEWRRMPFAELLPAAERGEVDVVCATLGITPERAQRVAFSVPYFETEIAVVARSGADEPRSIDELAGRRVAAGAGTTSERAVSLYLPRAIGVFENKSELPLRERLMEHEVDAAVLDAPSAEALIAQSRGVLTRLRGNLGAESYALALPKARSELLAAINRELLRMQDRGELRRLDTTYALRQRSESIGSR